MVKDFNLPKGIMISYSKELENFTKTHIKNNCGVKDYLLNFLKSIIELIEKPDGVHSFNNFKLITGLELDGFNLNVYICLFKIKNKKCEFESMVKGCCELKNINPKSVKYLENMKDNFKFDLDKINTEFISYIENEFIKMDNFKSRDKKIKDEKRNKK